MNFDKVPELPDPPVNAGRRARLLWFGGACLVLAVAAAAWWQFRIRPAAPAFADIRRSAEIAVLEDRLESLRVQLVALPEDAAIATRRALVEEAVARLNELMRLRAGPVSVDSTRLAGWQAQLDDLAARVAAQLSQDAETAAADLLHARQTAAAAEKLREALRLQREVNSSISTGVPKSHGREARLQQELEELTAGPLLAELQQALADAGAGKLDEADRLYALAADRQQVINARFAQSRFVSMEQLEKIDVERQTLRARPVMAALRAQDEAAGTHLRRRELFQAQRLVAQAREQLESAMRQFPKARVFDEDLSGRLNYLARRSAEWEAIQDTAYDLLLPRPGETAAALARSTVSQMLFVLVMSTNPSRNPGRARPVDSVNHEEATEFCRRLGWVLGAPVRLPSASDLRAAAPAPGFETGPMEEWLAMAEDGQAAPAASPDGKVRMEARTHRAGNLGFRIVAGLDLLAAGK